MMWWLRSLGSFKFKVAFAQYSLLCRALLQKRLMILRRLLIVAHPYLVFSVYYVCHCLEISGSLNYYHRSKIIVLFCRTLVSCIGLFCKRPMILRSLIIVTHSYHVCLEVSRRVFPCFSLQHVDRKKPPPLGGGGFPKTGGEGAPP